VEREHPLNEGNVSPPRKNALSLPGFSTPIRITQNGGLFKEIPKKPHIKGHPLLKCQRRQLGNWEVIKKRFLTPVKKRVKELTQWMRKEGDNKIGNPLNIILW